MQSDNDSAILKAIKDNNLIFVSAQPDSTYFHWQVEIYLYQFAKHGIIDRCYALFGYKGDSPSDYVKKLVNKYPTIKCYKDTRSASADKYSPTIRPHILAKFFKEYPQFNKNFFYHDSDIFLIKLPRFDLMLNQSDSNSYVSDTISYIGYEYIKGCASRYKDRHKNLRELDIFYGMCDIVGIDPNLVMINEKNSGGAQYLLKNINYTFWEEAEKKCIELYDYLCKYEGKYPIGHHIQKWTTDMWIILWLYWKKGGKTNIHKELDFSWATSTVEEYKNHNIFHLAGITGANCSDKFHKGKYNNISVFDAYINNPKIFDHINKNNATYEYINVIKEYINNVYIHEKGIKSIENHTANLRNTNITKFKINSDKQFNGVYILDESKQCCDRPVWRSENKTFIIFWTGSSWILTYSRYENEIGPCCGGIISIQNEQPYVNNWNVHFTSIDLI
jgi:hypothetical protein